MMRRLPLLILLLCSAPVIAQEIEPEDLRPGLIGEFRDNGARADVVSRLEPTIALNLGATEAPHPKMNHLHGTYEWKGYIKIFRNGEYTFSARLRGSVKLSIGGKELFAAESNAGSPEVKTSEKVTLKAGIQPIRVTYQRPTGNAVLELMWRVPQFRFEPIPAEQLGHLEKDENANFKSNALNEHGRFVFEEHGCIQCHQPDRNNGLANGLIQRTGPNLSQIGSRVYSGWLEAWLSDPTKLRPNTTMPKMFADDATGKAEVQAVSRYLASLGGPMPADKTTIPPKNLAQFLNKGRNLFTSVGCAACHQETAETSKAAVASVYGLLSPTGAKANYALGAVGSKTRGDRLAAYLQNPHTNNPTTRMPSLNLSDEEVRDLSLFLIGTRDEKIATDLPKVSDAPPKDLVEKTVGKDLKDFDKLSIDGKWNEVGKKLVTAKGCVNCHVVSPNNQALLKTTYRPLEVVQKAAKGGCVAETVSSGLPQYRFTTTDRQALTEFLKDGFGFGSKAPAYEARLAFKRFNCLNCHQRDGEGGLSTELVEQMQKLEKSENVDDIRPPTLNGVGHKLLTPWFKKVLTQSGRGRPWMSLRMPQYGEANVGNLAEGIAFLEGTEIETKIHEVELTPTKVEVGKLMIGKTGLGCIGCHDIAGIPNTGTRGPDLATTNQRVRYSWYRDWLEQPQRMAPNTRMPQIFIDGKSVFPSALKGHPDNQAEAMWAYMSLGSKLPLPLGLEPPKGLVIKVNAEPEILRTFMPDAGDRAIAVGFPGNVNIAFDANQCRLSYAWAGSFIDASPVWNNRGGAPAKILGPKIWTAPQGNPWSIGGSQEPPDFVKRSADFAYGKPPPYLKLYTGPRRVFFEGYLLDEKNVPTFKYRVLSESDAVLSVTEKVEPVKNSIATGLTRHFTLQIPQSQACYLFVGESTQEPKLFSTDGTETKLDLKSGAAEQDITGNIILLPNGDGSTALHLSPTFEGVRWRLQPRPNGGWQVMVKIPITKAETKGEMDLNLWSIGKPEPALIKGLMAK